MENVYHFITEFISHLDIETGVILKCRTNTGKKATIKFEFCNPSMIRYTVLPFEANPVESLIPLKMDWEPVKFIVQDNGNHLTLKSEAINLQIKKSPFSISFFRKDGSLITREEPLDTTVTGIHNVEPLGFWTSRTQVTAVRETMFLAPDEHFYGFGEKFTSFDKKGQVLTMWNVDAHGVMTEQSYKNVPFFMSIKGYGIFVNSTAKIIFNMGAESNVSYSFEVKDKTLDLYFIYGPSFKEILYRYTELTGRPSIPPKWSFGLWMSGGFLDIYKTRKSFEELAEKIRYHNLPCDVIHIDPWWMKEGSWCSLEWDLNAFPNPEKMIKKLKTNGFKLSLWENPYVPLETKMYEEGVGKGYFLRKKDGTIYLIQPWWKTLSPLALVDFTNPEAAKWYKEKHKPLFKIGVAAMKTDFGEAAPEDAVFFNGETGARMHNLYSLIYNKAVFEATKKYTGREAVVWGRSGYAGSQRYPTCWSGDCACTFASMAAVLRAGLSLSLSGFSFWSHDIGGFGTLEETDPLPELFIRWSQFGLLSPHSRCHGVTRRDPWDFGKEALDIFRFYDKLRYRLLPYIYSYAVIASKSGLPLVRPLILDYQDDPNTYDKDLQYMLGGEILVAPIYSVKGERSIYLPKGIWLDYWTKEAYDGPTTLHYQAPLDVTPIFIREDSIIPLAPEISYVTEQPFNEITLDIYLYSEAFFTLYDNDQITIHAKREKDRICLNISESNKTWTVKFNKIKAPNSVETNGKEPRKCLTGEEFEKALYNCWYYDGEDLLSVKIKAEEKVEVVVTLNKPLQYFD